MLLLPHCAARQCFLVNNRADVSAHGPGWPGFKMRGVWMGAFQKDFKSSLSPPLLWSCKSTCFPRLAAVVMLLKPTDVSVKKPIFLDSVFILCMTEGFTFSCFFLEGFTFSNMYCLLHFSCCDPSVLASAHFEILE